MSIEVVSQSSSPEAVAPKSDVAPVSQEKETKSASAENADETAEDSETSEENEDTESDAADNEADDSETAEDQSKEGQKPKKSGYKKKIGKLNKLLSEKDRELEYWRQQAIKPKADQEIQQSASPKAESDSGKPDPDDPRFKTHAEYVEALTDWKIVEREKAKEAQAKETQLKAEAQEQEKTFKERLNNFADSVPDWDEALDNVEDVKMSIPVREAIFSSENGPELMYALAKNKEEYARICALPEQLAYMELGKFQAKLAKPSEAEKKPIKTTNAPPPIKTLSAKGTSAPKSLHEMPYEEYKKARQEQMKSSGR